MSEGKEWRPRTFAACLLVPKWLQCCALNTEKVRVSQASHREWGPHLVQLEEGKICPLILKDRQKQITLLFIFLLAIPRASYQTNGKQHLCVNCFPWWCHLTIWDQKYTVSLPVFWVRNRDNLSPSRNNYTEPSVMGGADLGASKSEGATIMQWLVSSRAFGSLQSQCPSAVYSGKESRKFLCKKKN